MPDQDKAENPKDNSAETPEAENPQIENPGGDAPKSEAEASEKAEAPKKDAFPNDLASFPAPQKPFPASPKADSPEKPSDEAAKAPAETVAQSPVSHHSSRQTPSAPGPRTDPEKKRVLILGGGFAGTSTAIRLGKRARYREDIEVDFVSDENYFVFQPMLPEVASGSLEASHIVNPIRRLCPYVNFHRATVTNIDLENKIVEITGRDIHNVQFLHFDHLVVSLGLIVDLRRNPGMAEHALAMKTLGDAFFLRNEVIDRLEQADIEPDPALRQKLMTFVVVGGGFSGVETVAEINDMIKDALRYYKRIPKSELKVVLIHSRERILQELNDDLGLYAQKKLAERGVQMVLNARVSEATADNCRYKCKLTKKVTDIPTNTIVCTIGNAPHPVVGDLDIANDRGRLDANEFLQVYKLDENGQEKPAPGLWALGDAAFVRDITKKNDKGEYGLCPPTAQYAIRQGTVCADNIWAELHGESMRPFKFSGLGQMAVIGKLTGVASLFGLINFSGFPAFFLWRLVYWMKLPGILPKLRVALDWAIHLFFPTDLTQLRVFRTEKVERSHFHAGEYIFYEGDVGDSFYVIEKGQIEITKILKSGKEVVLATLKEGDSFGEVALLKAVARTASARCKTPVDCLTLSRTDFEALSSTFKKFRADLHKHVEAIARQNKRNLAHMISRSLRSSETAHISEFLETAQDMESVDVDALQSLLTEFQVPLDGMGTE